MQTTRGKFNVTINTDASSSVEYDGHSVAICLHSQQEFKLTGLASSVPPSLLGEFGDVITEATRLLHEAREAVVSAPQITNHKFSEHPKYEQGATLLTSLTQRAEANRRRTVFLARGNAGYFGIQRNGEWAFHQWSSEGCVQSWGTLAKNTNPECVSLPWLYDLREASPSDPQFKGFSDYRARYDGKSTVYRYIPVDDRYVAFKFNGKDFGTFGGGVAADKMESPFVWGEKNDGWFLESERSIASYASAAHAYLDSQRKPAPLEYCVVTIDTLDVDLGNGHRQKIPSFGYVTYNPNTNRFQYRYFRPDKDSWHDGWSGSGRDAMSQPNPIWLTVKPDESTLATNSRVAFDDAKDEFNLNSNKKIVTDALASKPPIAYFLVEGQYTFFAVPDTTIKGGYRAYHLVANSGFCIFDRGEAAPEIGCHKKVETITEQEFVRRAPRAAAVTFVRPDRFFSTNHAYYKAYLIGNRRETIYIQHDGQLTTYNQSISDIDGFAPVNWASPSSEWAVSNSQIDGYIASLRDPKAGRKRVIDNLLSANPRIAYMKAAGSLFAFVRNDDATYSVYHIPSCSYNERHVFSWGLTSNPNNSIYYTTNEPTPITPEEAAKMCPFITRLSAYRKNTSGQWPNTYYVRNFFDNTAYRIDISAAGNTSDRKDYKYPNQYSILNPIDWSNGDKVWTIGLDVIPSLISDRKETVAKRKEAARIEAAKAEAAKPVFLVPNDHFDSDGNFKFNEVYIAFYTKIDGKWMAYSGSTGVYTAAPWMVGNGLKGYLTLNEAPTPIGYRVFNTRTNAWYVGDISTLASTPQASGFGIEYRPWYGPSCVK